VKVGNLVRHKGAYDVPPWIGIVIGFDPDGDPIVRTTRGNSGVICPQWMHNVEVISESR